MCYIVCISLVKVYRYTKIEYLLLTSYDTSELQYIPLSSSSIIAVNFLATIFHRYTFAVVNICVCIYVVSIFPNHKKGIVIETHSQWEEEQGLILQAYVDFWVGHMHEFYCDTIPQHNKYNRI